MAIAVVDFGSHKNVSASSATVTLTPAEGNFMLALAGHYWKETSETLTITTPASSYTERVTTTDVNFEVMARAFTDIWTSGDGNDIVAAISGSANRGTVLAVFELSGVAGFDKGSASTTATIAPTGACTVDGSVAYVMFARQSAAEAFGTPTYTKTGTAAGNWTEYSKTQHNGTGIEIYVATAPIDAGETIGCTFSTTASTLDVGGVIAILSPTTSVPPTVAGPSNVYGANRVAESISTDVVVTDGSSATMRVQCTSGKGTVDLVDLDSGVTVSAGARGTTDVTLSGTPAQIEAAALDIEYTGAGDSEEIVDTAVVVTVDDGVNSPVADTFTVTTGKITIEDSTEDGVNAALTALRVTVPTAMSLTMQMFTRDVTGTDTDSTTLTATASQAAAGSLQTSLSLSL